MNPEVTVLMPVQNGAPYVREALRSLWRQTFADFELWVFDNGSTDATPEILKEEAEGAAAAGRLQVERAERNPGISRSMNEGIRRARGRWIARMDADDVALPERLACQVAYLRGHPDVAVCGTWARIFGGAGSYLHTPLTEPDEVRSMFVFQNPLVHSAALWDRQRLLTADLWYDEQLDAAQDMDLWFRCTQRMEMANVGQELLRYRVHAQSVSRVRAGLSRQTRESLVERALAPLRLQETAFDLAAHLATGRAQGVDSLDDLRASGRSLRVLHERNQELGHYPVEAFGRACAWCWSRTCLNSMSLGWPVLPLWREVGQTLPTPPHSPGLFHLLVSRIRHGVPSTRTASRP
jgi:hypothetical protein